MGCDGLSSILHIIRRDYESISGKMSKRPDGFTTTSVLRYIAHVKPDLGSIGRSLCIDKEKAVEETDFLKGNRLIFAKEIPRQGLHFYITCLGEKHIKNDPFNGLPRHTWNGLTNNELSHILKDVLPEMHVRYKKKIEVPAEYISAIISKVEEQVEEMNKNILRTMARDHKLPAGSKIDASFISSDKSYSVEGGSIINGGGARIIPAEVPYKSLDEALENGVDEIFGSVRLNGQTHAFDDTAFLSQDLFPYGFSALKSGEDSFNLEFDVKGIYFQEILVQPVAYQKAGFEKAKKLVEPLLELYGDKREK